MCLAKRICRRFLLIAGQDRKWREFLLVVAGAVFLGGGSYVGPIAGEIYISRHMRFHESIFPFKAKISQPARIMPKFPAHVLMF